MTDTERLRRLDRENEELRDMLNQVAWRLGLGDEVHYYSGDNYLACQLRVLDAINGLIERESDVETVQADTMEALRWVREHGGLDSVKKLLEWVVGHCSTRQQLDFDFWLSGRVMYELGFEEDMADRDEVKRRLLARLMPEGVEWPRYDTGEPVPIGGAIADELGCVHEVTSVEIFDNGADLRWNPDEPEECVWVGRGERVKRPAPKVLDADGLEIGIGDKLYDTETGCARIVRAVNASGTVEFEGCEDRGWFTKFLTHRAPVLAADGKPLREGEHVWHVETGTELVVKELPKPGAYQAVVVFAPPASHLTSFDPDRLTHERPERKCRDCAHWQKDPTTTTLGVCWELYGEYEGEDCYPARSKNHVACEEFMPRAKALAERGA